MKRLAARAATVCALLFLCAAAALAQDSDVKKYAVDVRIEPAAHAATVRTTLTLENPTSAPKREFQFRTSVAAEVRAVTVGGQTAQFDVSDDKRTTTLRIVRVTLPTPVPGRSTADVTVESRLAETPKDPAIAIGPRGTVLLPASHWFPLVNTELVQYGAATAPATVTVSGAAGVAVAGGAASGGAASGGAASGGAAPGSTFTQPLYGLPFVIAGNFGPPVTATASGVSLEAWLPASAGAEAKAAAARLLADAGKVLAFYTSTLGPAPAATFRVVVSDGAAGFSSASGVGLARQVLARDATDADTFELLANGLARIWTEGSAAVRGATPGPSANQSKGVAIVRDALPAYLASLAAGARFGAPAERQSFERASTALAQMGPSGFAVALSNESPAVANYGPTIATRGPLALRVIEREVGRDKFLAAVRDALAAARANGWITAAALRDAVAKSAGRDLSALYATWLDTAVQPDLIVGVPQPGAGAATSALRNLGTGDVSVDVVATTASGKKVTARTTIPSQGFGSAEFATTEAIQSVEVDPDHVIPQIDYSNDARPPRPSAGQLFADANTALQKQDFAGAESKLRALVAREPADAVAQAWLGRALLGLGRGADAEKAASAALAVEPAPALAIAWAHVVRAQALQAGGRAADAVALFRRAAEEASDTAAIVAARTGLIAAERAAGQAPPVDESVRKFFASFDAAVSSGVNTAQAEQFVVAGALPDFTRGLVTSAGLKWSTEIVRAEIVGPDEALVDARFTTVTPGTDPATAPALVRLVRTDGGWRIADILLLGQ